VPEYIVGPDGLILRRWGRDDAAQLGEAVADSVEHLRPWMSWIAHEPLSVTERRARIDSWQQAWLTGGDVVMGVFVDGVVAGGCGLHRRIGPGGLRERVDEIHAPGESGSSCEWQITREQWEAL
jgi:RimJ/RimL family protein N-acetyltransferase